MDTLDDGDTTTVHTQDIRQTAASMPTALLADAVSAPGALCLRDRLEDGRCRRQAFYLYTGKKSGWCS